MREHPVAGSRTLFALATFLFWASLYLFVPILPVYAESLGASLTMVGVVIGSYGIAQLLLRVPIGLVADAYGQRKLLAQGGIVAACLGALLMWLAPDPWVLFLGRTTTGVGAATWVVFAVLFASYYPRSQSERAIGMIAFVNGMALVSATTLGGFVADTWGFKATFSGAAILGAASLAIVVPVREPIMPRGERPFTAGLLGVAADPLLLTVSFMAIVVHFTAFTSVFTFIPVQASRLGATSTDLGFITMASLGSAAVASLAAPVLARRWGHRRTILSGSLLLGAGLLIVPFINRVLTLGVAQLVNGTGRGILYTLLMALSIRNVSPDKRATSMGVFQAFTAVGMVTGPLASGFLASSMSVSSVFYLSSALCLIPAGMSFLRILPRGEEGQPPVERHH